MPRKIILETQGATFFLTEKKETRVKTRVRVMVGFMVRVRAKIGVKINQS